MDKKFEMNAGAGKMQTRIDKVWSKLVVLFVVNRNLNQTSWDPILLYQSQLKVKNISMMEFVPFLINRYICLELYKN